MNFITGSRLAYLQRQGVTDCANFVQGFGRRGRYNWTPRYGHTPKTSWSGVCHRLLL